jgi:predicted nucleotide-binding protein (sugar kinase/HSP70/actin superfamily)
MGNLWIVIKTILEDLGLEVIVPPRPSRQSLDVGVRHSPEFACFPLKLSIGDLVAAIEKGADTVVMAGGIGPCRFGHYAQVEAQVLRDLGYDVDMVVLEPPQGHFSELLAKVRYLTGGKPLWRVWRALRFGFEKLQALDDLDRSLVRARPVESRPGTAAREHRRAVLAVERAGGIRDTRRAAREGMEAVAGVVGEGSKTIERAARAAPQDVGQPRGGVRPPASTGRSLLRVGLVGEIFMVAEPFANQDMERRLGEMGVEVSRSLYLSDWVRTHLLPGFLARTRRDRTRDIRRAARPYLGHFVGGEGLDSVGEAILFDRQGYDGVVHVAPFTCMPEIVAASLLPEASRDLGLPVLSLFLDEHSGEAGLQTRLEAFVDLLARRRTVRVKEAW